MERPAASRQQARRQAGNVLVPVVITGAVAVVVLISDRCGRRPALCLSEGGGVLLVWSCVTELLVVVVPVKF